MKQDDGARIEVANLLWLFSYEWTRNNSGVPAPDFIMVARNMCEAVEVRKVDEAS